MHAGQQLNLVRKQFLVTHNNVLKLKQIAKVKGTSATEVVRQAIDAFDPNRMETTGESDLMALVSIRLKEALADTRATRERLDKTLISLGAE